MDEKVLTHLDQQGNARMVDVSEKVPLQRIAIAAGHITLNEETRSLIGKSLIKKGDVLTIAEIAGVMAAKQTAGLIPLCHPLLLNKVLVKAMLDESGVQVTAEVSCTGPTGVEMEALTAVSVALLTVYDMCKAVDKEMVIGETRLLSKTKTALNE